VAASSTLSRRLSEFLGVALFAAALIWLIALLTYDPGDPVWFFNTANKVPANLIGRVGAFLAELSFQLVGYSAFVFPGVLAVVGWHFFWCRKLRACYTKLVGVLTLFACLSGFLSLAFGSSGAHADEFAAGGYFGQRLAAALSAYLNPAGTLIVILTGLFLSIIVATQFSFGRFFGGAAHRVLEACKTGVERLTDWRDERRKEKQRREVVAKHTRRAEAAAAENRAGGKPTQTARAAQDARASGPPQRAEEPAGVAEANAGPERPAPSPTIRRQATTPAARQGESQPAAKPPAKGAFTLPPVALLDPPRAEATIDERELMEAARLLEEKCREFAVDGSVVHIHPGPVVTTFEFKPEAGVKYSKITGLADDLSLALEAESVLIERIPGKSTVGIQIPNRNREVISLREVLESDAYRRSSSRLPLALGRSIHGDPFVADLSTMPHLLIAGSTGTGKSVCINSMLTSILYRATPDEVRLIMIDPKRLELGMYEQIPHLLTPVVVDPKQASNALGWAVREMEERYKTLAAEGVRNIEQYNRNVRAAQREKGASDEDDRKPLPYVLVIIDELADLMMVASNEVEESIARLAQMARAVGIHLILATQRPSVDVITGLIKANLPARISFRVSSKVDSRTILDGNGAEHLLGKGDMLFLPPASARLIRLHGPYISEQETGRLAAFLRKQGKPVYDESITAGEKAGESVEFEKDDLYDEAARIVVGSGQASISYLQRRLRIGFSRAARLVDMMEAEGLVSAAVGGKPREVLVDKGYFDEVDAQLR
jgi:S-DNA-T family DNA segregation ATPase FtsK/SpoIIIE